MIDSLLGAALFLLIQPGFYLGSLGGSGRHWSASVPQVVRSAIPDLSG